MYPVTRPAQPDPDPLEPDEPDPSEPIWTAIWDGSPVPSEMDRLIVVVPPVVVVPMTDLLYGVPDR